MQNSKIPSETIRVSDNITEFMIGPNRDYIIKMLIKTKCEIKITSCIRGKKGVECTMTASTQQQIEECKIKFDEILTQYSKTNEDTKDREDFCYLEAQNVVRNNAKTHLVPANKGGLVISKGGGQDHQSDQCNVWCHRSYC